MKRIRRWAIFLTVLIVLGVILWIAKVPILIGIGNVLIKEDNPQKVAAVFVLSGHPEERMAYAAHLYQSMDIAPRIITTGSGISSTLAAFGNPVTDAEVGKIALERAGVPDSVIEVLPRGTSTYEESEEILGYSIGRGFSRIMIISSRFHTRRVRSVFVEKFKESGIDVLVVGADPVHYETERWWDSEEGLLFVNNEYVKSLYYGWKY